MPLIEQRIERVIKGKYETQSGLRFVILEQNATLCLQFEQQPPLPIYPTSETDFIAKSINTKIKFEKDFSNLICALTISQDGQQFRAEKK